MRREQRPSKHSQDYDRKHGEKHIPNNLRSEKGDTKKNDKRELAREEHTNHFTNRASGNNS